MSDVSRNGSAYPGESRKTDYFGTFLDTLSRGGAEVTPAPAASHGSSAAGDDLPDNIVRSLAARGGAAPLNELLTPQVTLTSLMHALNSLGSFGLATVDNGTVRLTPDGTLVAQSLSAAAAVPPAS